MCAIGHRLECEKQRIRLLFCTQVCTTLTGREGYLHLYVTLFYLNPSSALTPLEPKFDFTVDEGKEWLNPFREKKLRRAPQKGDEKSCVTPAGTSNELDVQNEWEKNTHTQTHRIKITNNLELSTLQIMYSSTPSYIVPCVCFVCFLPIHSGHQWTYQPGSHRRKVTQDF